ncbi:DEAD/DEAH box helicase family protein [Paenibacillus sp. D9]|uniref:DEAD/DEAH box helicase family protein n=1 Tax=Paenibacillus sp. D9 TaxID=665792 RepID=UPI000675D255|nr:DEAD/DEAH box helicase family protein [Paenibacillus sp. D9]
MTTVNVIDAPCGYGKTSWAIQYMNSVPLDEYKFIYVTPYLEEVSRVKEAVTSRIFYEPHNELGDTKLDDLHRLLREGKNICTTHNLFMRADVYTRKLLQANNYFLILDEVLNVIKQVELKKNDLELLKNAGAISIEEGDNGLEYIQWNEDISHDSRFNDIKRMALSNSLLHYQNSALIWSFPVEIFNLFEQVYILTYLFKGQLQRYYFDLYQIRYKYLSVVFSGGDYELVPYEYREKLNKTILADNITIYEGNLNDIGNKSSTLSYSWFGNAKNKKEFEKLKNNAYNFLTNKNKANNTNALWTTFKGGSKEKFKKRVAPRSYADSYISVTARATNAFREKYNLVYLANRYMRPIEAGFFRQMGITIDTEAWALSELIQWIWRSRIRDGEPINIYIPSSRMRGLLQRYLSSEDFEEAPMGAIINQPPNDWHL